MVSTSESIRRHRPLRCRARVRVDGVSRVCGELIIGGVAVLDPYGEPVCGVEHGPPVFAGVAVEEPEGDPGPALDLSFALRGELSPGWWARLRGMRQVYFPAEDSIALPPPAGLDDPFPAGWAARPIGSRRTS